MFFQENKVYLKMPKIALDIIFSLSFHFFEIHFKQYLNFRANNLQVSR